MIESGHSIPEYGHFYRFYYMKEITFQKRVVKRKRNCFRKKMTFYLIIWYPSSPTFFQNKNCISKCSEIKRKQNRNSKIAYSHRGPRPWVEAYVISYHLASHTEWHGGSGNCYWSGPSRGPRRLSFQHQIRTAQTLEEYIKCLAFVEHF